MSGFFGGSGWGSALGSAAVGLGTAFLQSSAANKAAKQQASALSQATEATQTSNAEALAAQERMFQQALGAQQSANTASQNYLTNAFNTTQQNFQPYLQTGQNALATYMGQLGTSFQASPGYDFQVSEGLRAVQNGAAARGQLNSGATLKALQRYGQGVANQDYGNWLNRWNGLATMGQNSAAGSGAAAQNYGTAASNSALSLGNSMASLSSGYGDTLSKLATGLGSNLSNLYTAGGMNQANATVAGANGVSQGVQNSLATYAYLNPRK